jgi:ribosome recycling factor
MDLFFKTKLNTAEKKMGSYMSLLNFRYQNLCVKAEPVALIPVDVHVFDQTMNIEEVAEVAVTDDYHLAIIPNNNDYLKPIMEAVTFVHPEFKLSMEKTDVAGEEREYLEYEMPEVDKNRRDFLNEAVKSLHDEAKVKIDQVYTEEKASYAEMLSQSPEDLDEVNVELERMHDDTLNTIQGLRDDKLEEIEDGYQRYLSKRSSFEDVENNSGYDVTQSMVLQ